jgi:hypothetical protein
MSADVIVPENDSFTDCVPIWLGAQTWQAVLARLVRHIAIVLKTESSVCALNFVGFMRAVAQNADVSVRPQIEASFIVLFPFFRSLEFSATPRCSPVRRKLHATDNIVDFSKLYLQNLRRGWLHSVVSWNSFLSGIPSNLSVPNTLFELVELKEGRESLPPQLQSHASRSKPDVAGQTMSPASAPENAQS